MPRWFYARQIVEEQEVRDAVDQFRAQFQRFEEAFEALKWLLARKCVDVKGLSRTVYGVKYILYRQASDPLARTPEIIVLFTYNDNEVVIIGINAKEAEVEID